MSPLPVRPPERSANIFINYRREDSAGHAGRLFDGLSDHFPGRLFMDVDTIAPGIDFGDAIEQAVGSCEVLIVIIGRDWLTIKNAAGQRRLDDPADFVRLEVEAALARGIRVIPVLVQDTPMPGAAELPPSLAKLARRNAIELSDVRWSYDVDRLAGTIQGVLRETVPVPPAEEPRQPPTTAQEIRRVWPRAAVFLLAAVVLVSAGWVSKNRFASASAAVVEKPAPVPAPSLEEPEPAVESVKTFTPAAPEEVFHLPEVAITSPRDGDNVGKCSKVRGTVSGLGIGQRAFLGVRNREGTIYPRGELFPDADGRWFFEAESSRHDFELFVLIATGPEAGEALSDGDARKHGLRHLPERAAITEPIVRLETGKLGRLIKSRCDSKGP